MIDRNEAGRKQTRGFLIEYERGRGRERGRGGGRRVRRREGVLRAI